MARIAVVDDHRLFLMGFSLLLERLERPCTPTAFNTPAALLAALARGERFDLVICDLLMNGMNGLAFIAALRGSRHGNREVADQNTLAVPVLMISGISTPPPLREMQKLGAQGFVHKSSDDDILLEAIDTVLEGKTYFDTDNTGALDIASRSYGDLAQDDGDGEGDDATEVPSLTPRQQQILQLISNGAANKEIARALSISENTVKTHLKQIFELLRVNKRTACVRAAHSLGIL